MNGGKSLPIKAQIRKAGGGGGAERQRKSRVRMGAALRCPYA